MEPVTHALASLTLAQAAQKRLPRYGKIILVVSGVAPDLDFAGYLGGPGAFLKLHRAALHSLAGSVVLGCAIAGAFCFLGRRAKGRITPPATSRPLRFLPALAVCGIGIAGHLLLDLASGIGVQLLWPFHAAWYAWNLAANLDPWILILLLAGLLLPLLFRLVSEEIGDRKNRPRGITGAIAALVILVAYLGGRAYFRSEAVNLLLAREYHGRIPLSAGAYPDSSSPLDWRGVALTDSSIEEVDVPLGPGEEFDPDRSVTHYKPEDSPALEAAQATSDAESFLRYAEFPIAIVSRNEDGYRVELQDLRFAPGDSSLDNIIVRVDLNAAARVVRQEFRYAGDAGP